MSVTIVIPSLNPDEKLTGVVLGLLDAGLTDILLVDDGSDAAHQEPFRQAEQHPEVTVLHHEGNRGKGRALKTAFAYVAAHRPNSTGAVTVDGDGQHGISDICHLAQVLEKEPSALWLGVRDFTHSDVPRRSRFGNVASRLTMRFLCGVHVSDTQTGLRGIPREFLEELTQVGGERFEYETNMLLECRRKNIPIREIRIDTIYLEDNASSHFKALSDGWRVYRLMLGAFLRFAASGLISYGVDISLFTLLMHVLNGMQERCLILAATVAARVVSSLVNFTLNRKAVFRSGEKLISTLWRYYLLCICQMLTSAGAVILLTEWLLLPAVFSKCVVDALLFVVSYTVQQRLIFSKKQK